MIGAWIIAITRILPVALAMIIKTIIRLNVHAVVNAMCIFLIVACVAAVAIIVNQLNLSLLRGSLTLIHEKRYD